MIKYKNNKPTKKIECGNIYALQSDYSDDTVIISGGTPLKIISVKNSQVKILECEDCMGNNYFVPQQYFSNEEIKDYPKLFLIIRKKIKNLCYNIAVEFKYGSALVFMIIMIPMILSAYFISSPYNFWCSLFFLIIGIFLATKWDYIFEYDSLFSKKHLKELKILLQRSDCPTERSING